MMDWTREIPKPKPTKPVAKLISGEVELKISPSSIDGSAELWQWFYISFGEHSSETMDECCKTWPREAIRLAREQLDAFEAALDSE